MKVQILGTGCPKCRKLMHNVKQAVASGEFDVQIEKIEDISKIMEFGVMMTPALAIDGDVRSAGKVVSVDNIQDILKGE